MNSQIADRNEIFFNAGKTPISVTLKKKSYQVDILRSFAKAFAAIATTKTTNPTKYTFILVNFTT
ncbi:MAG: hypothetical protein PVJ52_00760 [Candidatus Woesebacteria bacterium]